jgi:membrane protein implicated in regulation of membrane protease activity
VSLLGETMLSLEAHESLRETTSLLFKLGLRVVCGCSLQGSFIGLFINFYSLLMGVVYSFVHTFTFSFLIFLLIFVLLVWAWKRMVGGREPLLDGCEEILIILGGNGCIGA